MGRTLWLSPTHRVAMGADSLTSNMEACWFSLNYNFDASKPRPLTYTHPALLTAHVGLGTPSGSHPTSICPLAGWPLTPSQGSSHILSPDSCCSEGHRLHLGWPLTFCVGSPGHRNILITFDTLPGSPSVWVPSSPPLTF